jgi:ceramide glucosyltransferase
MLLDTLWLLLATGALFGCLFLIAAARLVPQFARPLPIVRTAAPAVTILKPLHGDEFGLFDNLASFCKQNYSGPVQIIFGVASTDDPAIGVVERLRTEFPTCALELVVDPRSAGSNPKVANLVNMSARIAHGIVVIADSDIRVEPDYLLRIVQALQETGGAVTCPYYGIATGSFWSDLSRLMIDSHFLPSVLVSARFKLARPCLGSTIALQRRSLAAIGGFEAVADCLADDYAIGAALAKRGEPVSVLPFAVGHVCSERSLRELWTHELRWALTIRSIDPWRYAGLVLTHPLPLALMALGLGGATAAALLALAAVACRAWVVLAVERSYGVSAHPYWLIPLRDLLSLAVFVAGFVARDVRWKGRRFKLLSEGTLMSQEGSPLP